MSQPGRSTTNNVLFGALVGAIVATAVIFVISDPVEPVGKRNPIVVAGKAPQTDAETDAETLRFARQAARVNLQTEYDEALAAETQRLMDMADCKQCKGLEEIAEASKGLPHEKEAKMELYQCYDHSLRQFYDEIARAEELAQSKSTAEEATQDNSER